MIEFTLSRVCMCICGVVMLSAAVGYMGLVEDNEEGVADQRLAEDIASMLDAFQTSSLDELYLEGNRILPSGGFTLTVTDGLVVLDHDGRRYYGMTILDSDFELDRTSSVTLRRSVTEGLGDVADGVGEDIHLLQAVVQVH